MTDIVARLREYGMNAPTGFRVYHDAANEIERLRAELAAANKRIEEYVDDIGDLRLEVINATEERNELRTKLDAAREMLKITGCFTDESIDAALKGDGDGSSADAG